MQHESSTPDPSRELMGKLLRFGVLTSAVLVLVGGILYIMDAPPWTPEDFSHFHGEATRMRGRSSIWIRSSHGDAKAIIQMGIIVLIATPIARVVLALAGFLRARDWIYVTISTLILGLLLFTLFFG